MPYLANVLFLLYTSPMHTGVVEKIVNGGWGLIRSSEGVVFLPYVLPGEEVEYRIKDRARGIIWGELLRVVKSSDRRITPPCPYYGECGGCILQHMSYEDQLKLKEELFREDLKKTGDFTPEYLQVTGSGEFRYRVRAKLKADNSGKIGFIRKSTNTVFPIKSCMLFKPEMEEFINSWNSLEQPPHYHQLDLLLNTDTRQLYVNLSHEADYENLQKLFPDVIFTCKGRDIEDGAVSEVVIGKYRYQYSPSVFFQNNHMMWEKMLASVDGMLHGCSSAIDLYCGVGFFTPLLSEYTSSVTGVENSRLSIDLARRAFPEAEFHRMPVEKFRFPKSDILLCDPPRSGLSSYVHNAIKDNKPRTIVYISCNAQTFCRDLKKLRELGYSVDKLEMMDLFPQSAHFEVLCKLTL